VSNAIKYNREGGLVVVEAVITQDGRLRLGVTDSGMGIATKDQALIFEPFQRLTAEKEGIEGAGIGLTITKRLVEMMGGSITLTSTPGLGSCFEVELPMPSDPPGLAALEPGTTLPTPESPATQGGVVLYVEDDKANLTLVKHVLGRRPDVALLTADCGEEGLSVARARRPDLILLDIHLPDMDGHQVFTKLQEDASTKGIPVVVVSASAMPTDVGRLMAAGVDCYLTKPLDIPLFLKTVDELLIRGRNLPKELEERDGS
jgi:CheY-like chemotaxis protein